MFFLVFSAVYSPIIKSNAYVSLFLVFLLPLITFKLNLKNMSFIFFVIPSFVYCFLVASFSIYISVFNFLMLAIVFLSLGERHLILCIWLSLYFSASFLVLAICSFIFDGNVGVFLTVGRILIWDVLGVGVNANIIGLYSAVTIMLCLVLYNLFARGWGVNFTFISFITISIACLVLSGSRSAALFLFSFLLLCSIKSFKLIITLLVIVFFSSFIFDDAVYSLRIIDFSVGDSGRFEYYKDAYSLWRENGYLPLDDLVFIEKQIILDNLFLGAIIRYGPIFFVGLICFCVFLFYRLVSHKNNSLIFCNSLAFSSVILGFIESSFIGSIFLLLIVLICSKLSDGDRYEDGFYYYRPRNGRC